MDKIIFPRFIQNNLPLALIVGGVIGLWGIVRGIRSYREEQD